VNFQENNNNFKTAEIAKQLKNITEKFENLLEQLNTPEISSIHSKLHQELKQYYQQGFLTVAFVGQYSAGKSTMISALTGQRNIRIGADITTDETANYDWNAIKLIDTPGLFTDRKDHDEITYDAIRQSDLLVFSLTYMLFDSITVENFKKLAYELGYRWKMMLVVNKMADGAGEEEELIVNYRKSLAAAIEPYSLDDFPVCFIDAKDYCEGVDEKEDFLVEVSRFQTFTDELNVFTKQRSSLAKFDTPIRIALGYLSDAQLTLTRDSNKDSVFFELLNRLSRKIYQERDRLRTKIRGIALRLSAAIANEGTTLASAVGIKDIEALGKQAENNVDKLCKKAGLQMEEAVKSAVGSLEEEIKEVFESDLAQAFIARLEVNQKVSAHNVDSGVDVERLRKQVDSFKKLGEFSQSLVKYAIKPGASQAQGAFLRAGNVAGGKLHQNIYGIGKFLGFKFKPYGAVNIAKGIGNVAKVLGPIVAIAALAGDIHAKEQEEKQDKEIADGRREITSQFITMGKDLESQIEGQLRELEAQVYGEIEMKIAEDREKEEDAIAASNTWVKKLGEIRKDFDLVLQYITKVTENT
jgi:50S ribosome-binding GTPase/Dynamin-like helical domain